MPDPAPGSPPPLDPLSAVPLLEAAAGNLLELLTAKVELALLELEEETRRLQARVVLTLLMAGALGLAFCALNAALLWAVVAAIGHGPEVLLAGAGVYAVLALIFYLASRHSALAFRPPLTATLAELRKDSQWLKSAR
jgi:uncharacterized membrane protein YqjE